ncbi:hypothetical protein [Pleurocapsa sp. FMAR1]|uniref:hypothetical protein n=1 Tax=Pleurocapsa sp. FMAR1 TaxID=3040204 RepID=UPI0029C83D3A|nr:hypothetical protein [Pleurocapsa sp. FMAR1]
MVRDSQSVLRNTPESKAPFKERLQETADKKYTNGEFNNNLIAVEPNNQTINLMIDEISKLNDPKENNPLDINKSELDQNAPFKTGPNMATRMMRKQLGLEPGPKATPTGAPQATQYMNPKLKDHLMKNIDLVTDVSERDERDK